MRCLLILIAVAASFAGAAADTLLQRFDKALELSDAGSYAEAMAQYELLLSDPNAFRPGGLTIQRRIIVYGNAGRCQQQFGDHRRALDYLLAADSLRTKYSVTSLDPGTADDCHDIAYSFFKIGDTDKGNQWGEKYATALQRISGMGKLPAKAWLFLFKMNMVSGNQAKALEYARRIVNNGSVEDYFDSPSEAVPYLLEMCQLLYNMNEVDKALELAAGLEEGIAEEMPGSVYELRINNLLTAITISNPELAEQYLQKALDMAIAMEQAGKFDVGMLAALYNAAQYMLDTNPDISAEMFSNILDECREHNLENSTIYAQTLNGIAILKGFADPEVPDIFEKAFDIYSGSIIADIANLILVGNNWLCSLAGSSRPVGEVETATAKIAAMLKSHLTRDFSSLSEGKRELYWQQVRPWYQIILPEVAYAYNSPTLWQLLYDCLLQSRGILLTSAVSLSTIVRESGDPDLIALYKQYSGFEKDDNLAAALEARLLNESKKYGDYLAPFAVATKDVSASLKDNELAIEFVRYDSSAYANLVDSVTYLPNVKYLALLLNNKSATPNFVELCGEEELTGSSPGDLYNSVWSKIEPYLGDVDRIYFSPDGELFSLPLEYSRMPDGRFLWERYDCRRLSSTRELARQGRSKGEGIAIFGGMKYDMTVDDMAVDAEKYRDVTEEMVYERGERDVLLGVMPLPGTLRESEEIGRTALTYMGNPQNVNLFKEKEATEAAFKSISGKRKQIIHIATHGFYNSPADRSLATDGSDETTALSREREMMRHSGLLFSGVDNVRYDEEIPEGVEDGVLDAGEISTLDLHGTDLVTLSACRTALGEVSGDGVFGLQRGFKKAGAGSILMSLWKVDDDATCLFMTEFYNNLLNPGSGATGDKQKSLELARKAVMSRPDWHDFKYWGGFILLDAVH